MFEKYTEQARRVIFFARYEASQFGSDHIETEHLLLGILREDRALSLRLLKAPEKIQSIRDQIEKRAPRKEKVSTSVDLPLSMECRRVLVRASEEAGRLNDDHIATVHLLLGLLREEKCGATKIMAENGLASYQLERELQLEREPQPEEELQPGESPVNVPEAGPVLVSPSAQGVRDLTAAAGKGALNPLIGRDGELDRAIHILSRRTRNNPVLIGEPGVGKNALVHGLAQRIADGVVPENLAGRPILAMDASALLSAGQGARLAAIANRPKAILYIQGLFDLAGKGDGWSVLEAIRVLEPYLTDGRLQSIATGTPFGLRLTVERAASLARHFEVVPVLPPGEEEALRIVSGVKGQYEKFHGVVITDEAVETAVSASRWFLRHRQLPDRAIDLIDEAAARVRLRCESEPREIAEIRKRIRLITREMENAIANHQFEQARSCSEAERRERQNVERLREQREPDSQSNIVSPEDILESVAARAGVPVSAVKSVLQVKNAEQLELVAKELAAQFPIGGREWAESLVTYLAGCPAAEAEKLALAIRAAKARIDLQ